jgi:hypothetical protein
MKTAVDYLEERMECGGITWEDIQQAKEMENHLSMQKFKLIKEYEDYYLISDKEIESGDEYVKLDNRPRTVLLGTTAPSTKVPKLSKQNCDEIFGVVDVEKLAMDWRESTGYHDADSYSYILGFKKAMELNKDKVFTLEDVRKAFNKGYLMKFNPSDEYTETLTGLVQFIQQPTEIEVTFNPDEKDSEGCLILKKI